MSCILKDRSFDFSETEVKYEVLKLNEMEDGLTEIEFDLTFSYGFLDYTHRFVWINEDVESLVEQIEGMGQREIGSLGVLSPGISFTYEACPHEEGMYTFTILMDSGYVNSGMGTDSGIGISLYVHQEEVKQWISAVLGTR